MVKSDIVSTLCDRGYYKSQATEVVDDIFQIIQDSLVQGEPVQISGFGTFDVKIRKGRSHHNVVTREMEISDDNRVPVFRPSNNLKELVREGKDFFDSMTENNE